VALVLVRDGEIFLSPMDRKSKLLAASLALPLVCFAADDTAASDKSRYSFFNRTPVAKLRELTTDRPDLTESPFTVDAGWWQLEMDLVAFARDHDKSVGTDVKTTTLSLATLNLKVGLTPNVDLQTVIESFARVRAHDRIANVRESRSGFGDITSRLKINLWGNDGGRTAFAVMPFIKWPTNRHGLGNNSVEGGIILPLALADAGGWGIGMMTEVDVVRNASDTGYATDWMNTVTFSRDLTGNIGCYLELATTLTRGPDLASFDCGVTYGVTRNVQLDAGVNLGLTKATEDITIFTGLSVRF
jgi:hypothetical protein